MDFLFGKIICASGKLCGRVRGEAEGFSAKTEKLFYLVFGENRWASSAYIKFAEGA